MPCWHYFKHSNTANNVPDDARGHDRLRDHEECAETTEMQVQYTTPLTWAGGYFVSTLAMTTICKRNHQESFIIVLRNNPQELLFRFSSYAGLRTFLPWSDSPVQTSEPKVGPE